MLTVDAGIGPAGYHERHYTPRDWRCYSGILAEIVQHSSPGAILDLGAGCRFLPSLARLGRQFDQSVVVWSGTAADAIFARHPSFHGQGRDEWFRRHMTQVACWQGSVHQTQSNFLGVPLLSPYHSPELWNEVLFRHDPETMQGDLRADLGHCLFGREVRWLSQNPSPPPYASVHQGDPRAMYARYVSCGKTQGTPHRDDE